MSLNSGSTESLKGSIYGTQRRSASTYSADGIDAPHSSDSSTYLETVQQKSDQFAKDHQTKANQYLETPGKLKDYYKALRHMGPWKALLANFTHAIYKRVLNKK
jgi:hypothetical protein